MSNERLRRPRGADPDTAAARRFLSEVFRLEARVGAIANDQWFRDHIERIENEYERVASAAPIDVEVLNVAILDELADLWGEPSDYVSKAVRPQVARSIAERYVARLAEGTDR